MSGPVKGRGLIAAVFKNFRDSFKVLNKPDAAGHVPQYQVGSDPMGNNYYEIPPDRRYAGLGLIIQPRLIHFLDLRNERVLTEAIR